MIGIIQKVLIELLEEHGGQKLRADVLSRAGLAEDFDFRLDRNYSDEECRRLIEASIAITGLSRDEVFALYADRFLAKAQQLFPTFFKMSKNSREFLQRQPAIHASLGTGLRDIEERKAVADKFSVEDLDDGSLLATYTSPNGLCDLYRALAQKLADNYGDAIGIEVRECGKSCGGSCRLRLFWPPVMTEQSSAPCALSEA